MPISAEFPNDKHNVLLPLSVFLREHVVTTNLCFNLLSENVFLGVHNLTSRKVTFLIFLTSIQKSKMFIIVFNIEFIENNRPTQK